MCLSKSIILLLLRELFYYFEYPYMYIILSVESKKKQKKSVHLLFSIGVLYIVTMCSNSLRSWELLSRICSIINMYDEFAGSFYLEYVP